MKTELNRNDAGVGVFIGFFTVITVVVFLAVIANLPGASP